MTPNSSPLTPNSSRPAPNASLLTPDVSNILWSFAPHDISIILSLAGEEPSYIDSVGSNFLHARIADVTMTNLKFPLGIGGLRRKCSQGTNSDKGNRRVERILTLRQTCRLRFLKTYPILVDAVRCYFKEQGPDLSWVAQH